VTVRATLAACAPWTFPAFCVCVTACIHAGFTAACVSSAPLAPVAEVRAASVGAARVPLALDVDVSVLPDAAGLVGGIATRVCPRGAWPRSLVPENRRARAFLVSAVDDDGNKLPLDKDGVRTKDLKGCARLVVDVGRLADAVADKDLALRAGDDLIITPDLWLWRPEPLDDATLFLRMEPPAGTSPFNALLPWTVRESDDAQARLVVDRSTWALKSDAAFGHFDVTRVTAGGAVFHVARLDDGRAPAPLDAWIAASASAVATLSGRYPLPSVNVLVVPTRVTRPIVVAFFSRGGGPTATLFVGDGALADGALADGALADAKSTGIDPNDIDATGRWALTHELAHALMPPVKSNEAWLNEGLATWHQELLARRAGMLVDDVSFWRELVRGLTTGKERAASDGLSTGEASERMHDVGAYQHAYWSGVGVMLIAEVAARRQGASLDDVVRALRAAFPRDDVPRTAHELLAVPRDGRARVAADIVAATFRAQRDRPFPDVDPVLRALGVLVDKDGNVTGLDDTAPDAALRKMITAPRTAPQ
jgi:hypothetical protein